MKLLEQYALSLMLFICGLVHSLPAVGLLGSNWLNKLYGVTDISANLTLLMQHRALMFGLLGILFFYGAFKPQIQIFASVLAIVSMTGFIAESILIATLRAIAEVSIRGA